MNRPLSIVIIGGGVSGITTALLLNIHGYDTYLYTEKRLDRIDSNDFDIRTRRPEDSSLHAAASVIPHTVNFDKLNPKRITDVSQFYFHRLCFSASCGIRLQRHYEIFEFRKGKPDYYNSVRNFDKLPPDGSGYDFIPKRKGAKKLYGWYFDTFFCETPTYISRLYDLYIDSGGKIIERKLNFTNLKNLNCDIFINCTGVWSNKMFEDDLDTITEIVRGHYIKVHIYEVPLYKKQYYFSYNYYPKSEIYSNAEGKSADIYFYPRSDGWYLGGSRQKGTLDKDFLGKWGTQEFEWTGEETVGKTIAKDEWGEIEIPEQIWELNREIVYEMTKIDIKNYPTTAGIGYRFTRKPEIRLEGKFYDGLDSRLVVHNYGHGGAGYTLSCGCANEVINIIEEMTKHRPQFRKKSKVRGQLTLLSVIEDLSKLLYERRQK